MMIETTLRYHTHQAPADDHNARTPDTIAAENRAAEQGTKDRWIDPQGVHEVLGPGQTVLEAFDTVFGDPIDEYNGRQKRADRKMTVEGYLESVENSRRGRPVKAIKRANERAKAQGREEDVRKEAGQRSHYEVVFSLGNVKPLRDAAGKVVIDKKTGQRVRPDYVGADVTRQILQDYLAGWAARNPNLYLFRADYHADEWYKVTSGGTAIPGLPGQWCQGEAHGHLSFVAFGEGYQRGPRRQASITKALAAMGYTDYEDATGRRVTAWEQWQEAERDVIKTIARNYGYAIVSADDSREALAADEYAELADLRGAVQDAKAELAATELRTGDLDAREAAVIQREKELDDRERAIADQEKALEEQRERLAGAVSEFTAQKQEAHDLEERLPRLRKKADDEEDRAARAAQEAERAYQTASKWNGTTEALQAQETALKARIAALQGQESEAYRDAQERGYRDGYEKGQQDGVASPLGQVHATVRKADGEGLTQEERIANALRDGVGRG